MLKVLPFLALFSLMAYATPTPTLLRLSEKYLVSQIEATFLRAYISCQSLGFKLATVSNKDEFIQLNNTINPLHSHWLGGAYAYSGVFESNWIWTQSDEKLTYTNWRGEEPRPTTGVNCLLMDVDGLWDAADCDSKNYYVCET